MNFLAQIAAIFKALPGIIAGINLLADKLNAVLQNQVKIMAELDDLQASVSALTDAVTSGTAEISALVSKVLAAITPTGVDPVAVEAAATQIKAQADAINAAVTAAKAQAGV